MGCTSVPLGNIGYDVPRFTRERRRIGRGALRHTAYPLGPMRRNSISCCCRCDLGGLPVLGDRRRVVVSLFGVVPLWLWSPAGRSMAQSDEGLGMYQSDSYLLKYPESWEVTGKAGADVLFKDPARRGVNIGVTILPVRIDSVAEYGDLQNVSEKILQAERAKDGSLSAEMMNKESLILPGSGVQAYDYEYEVGTTRGTKRILSRVCIRDRKLYVVNGTLSCGKVDACQFDEDGNRILKLMRQSVESFDVL